MSAFITLSSITFSTPDGRELFSDLNLSFGPERTGLVGRNGVGKTTLFRLIANDLRPESGSISVNGTVGILRQTVQVPPRETIANLFGVTDALALLRRVESGLSSLEEIADADWTLESRMASALSNLGLDANPDTPLVTLSGGQRTRAALAALVFSDPDFILLDEPTNNLDREGREAVIGLLTKWRRGALVVSHDRELLEGMDAIVELTSLGATRYGGNWSRYRELKDLELAAARHDIENAERRAAEISRRAQETAERKARKDATGKRKAAKGGEPRIALGLLKNRSEATSGETTRLYERRHNEALDAVTSARERIEIVQPLSVALPPTHLPATKNVLAMDRVTAGYEPDRPVIHDLSLTITGPERIAIAGPNGSGKTTLLALLTGELQPWAGTVRVMVKQAMLDQRVSILDPALSIRDNFRRIHPDGNENACRAALARFMFRADAALQTVGTLSGGQMLRAGLACVLGGATPPSLLILDEPTNHLDLDSIETIEAGLQAYDGALLVVSHDERFLQGLGISRRVELSSAP